MLLSERQALITVATEYQRLLAGNNAFKVLQQHKYKYVNNLFSCYVIAEKLSTELKIIVIKSPTLSHIKSKVQYKLTVTDLIAIRDMNEVVRLKIAHDAYHSGVCQPIIINDHHHVMKSSVMTQYSTPVKGE